MEQRMVALKMYNIDKLLKESNAELLDKSDNGNEKYLIKEIFNQDAYFLKYTCPSTGRIYLSGIEPEFAKSHKADECMSWKFSSNNLYNKLIKET